MHDLFKLLNLVFIEVLHFLNSLKADDVPALTIVIVEENHISCFHRLHLKKHLTDEIDTVNKHYVNDCSEYVSKVVNANKNDYIPHAELEVINGREYNLSSHLNNDN